MDRQPDSLGLTPQDYKAYLAGFRARMKDLLEDESLTSGEKVARIVERMAQIEEE